MIIPFKSCLHCEKELVLKCTRDLTRKKYCSYACRQLYRYKNDIKFQQNFEEARKLAHTPEANKKKANKGSKNGRYIQDRSLVKCRNRYENYQWKRQVFERDNFTCQFCKQRGGQLQADHIKPWSLYPEFRYDLNNGRTLCITCHKKTDTYGWKMVNIIKESKKNGTI